MFKIIILKCDVYTQEINRGSLGNNTKDIPQLALLILNWTIKNCSYASVLAR